MKWWGLFPVVLGIGCSMTPYGAHRDAQLAYEHCVELNGEAGCQKEKETLDRRRKELDRDRTMY
jgi:hypothetical protein